MSDKKLTSKNKLNYNKIMAITNKNTFTRFIHLKYTNIKLLNIIICKQHKQIEIN